MSRSLQSRLLRKIDDWRVSLHLRHVEVTLRGVDVSHLTPPLQQARERHLDSLHSYAARGVFPRNYEHPGYAPCFIDRNGRECAVAHLLICSGDAKIAHNIAVVANDAYVRQMTIRELDEWAAQAGLSREELALIQPGYYLTFTDSFLSLAIATWAAGFVPLVINAVQIARKRHGVFVPVIGLVTAIVLLVIGALCLDSAITAYQIGTHPDGYPYNLPLRDVPPLNLGGLISLGLATLTGGLGFYRLRDFIRARGENRHQIVGN
jgi:hypothetical protein